MRFLIFSDIHGNYEAFKTCVDQINKLNINAIIFCGDYVTDFPESNEVINLIRACQEKYKCYVIKGNRDEYIINYSHEHDERSLNIRAKNNIVSTYETLSEENISWICKLPSNISIKLPDDGIMYVSHECTYDYIENCRYKIFGHSHKQCNFIRDNVKYINPGSVGITTDEGIYGAQFSILEVNEEYEKIEGYLFRYDIDKELANLKNSKIYSDEIQWGKLLEKQLKTGYDIPNKCIEEYNKMRNEHHFEDESIELWKIAVERTM